MYKGFKIVRTTGTCEFKVLNSYNTIIAYADYIWEAMEKIDSYLDR